MLPLSFEKNTRVWVLSVHPVPGQHLDCSSPNSSLSCAPDPEMRKLRLKVKQLGCPCTAGDRAGVPAEAFLGPRHNHVSGHRPGKICSACFLGPKGPVGSEYFALVTSAGIALMPSSLCRIQSPHSGHTVSHTVPTLRTHWEGASDMNMN